MAKTQTVEVLVEGGKATAGASLGGTLGPLKVNIGQVVNEINDKTKDFKGMKVPVKVLVNVESKEFAIEIGTPPAAQLLLKEVNLDKGSGEVNIVKAGVISIEQVFKVARMKQSSLIVNDTRSAVKTIVGTCQSIGLLIDGKEPKNIIKEINEGLYDELFSSGKTEPDDNKRKMLSEMSKSIDLKKKQRQKEKEAAKAEAEATAKAAAQPAVPGAVPASQAATGSKPAPAAAKPEAKKEAVKK